MLDKILYHIQFYALVNVSSICCSIRNEFLAIPTMAGHWELTEVIHAVAFHKMITRRYIHLTTWLIGRSSWRIMELRMPDQLWDQQPNIDGSQEWMAWGRQFCRLALQRWTYVEKDFLSFKSERRHNMRRG